MQPRIYTYKITFPDQGWWYWGWHKEKEFGEDYSGSPKTHKEKWENFEWEMQILEFFDCEVEAQKVENRLIKPDLNNPNCLNEHCGSVISSKSRKEGGKLAGEIAIESGRIYTMWDPESSSKGGKTGGKTQGRRNVESGHIESISTFESCSKGGKIGGKRGGKTTSSQKWRCLETGFITSPGSLSSYQKARGIDTSLREKVV